MTATVSVGDSTAGVAYVWYLNGVSKATGSPYTFGSALAAGFYRLDMTAYAADGTRAGSATVSFQVPVWAPTYTITYSANGGSGSAPVNSNRYPQGATVVVSDKSDSMGNTNYAFAGWNTTHGGTGTSYAAGANFFMGTANLTLYAVWIPSTFTFTGSGTDIVIPELETTHSRAVLA